MWGINYWKSYGKIGNFEVGITDMKGTELVKCKLDGKCNSCGNEIKRGSYCLAGRHTGCRVCLSCSDEFFNNLMKSFFGLAKTMKIKKENINTNREEYEKNNMVCSLQD